MSFVVSVIIDNECLSKRMLFQRISDSIRLVNNPLSLIVAVQKKVQRKSVYYLQEERGPLLQKEIEMRQVVVDLHEPLAQAGGATANVETDVTKL